MSDEKPIKEPIRVSLSGFIEENHKLLSTIGIFTALTVFSFNLKLSLFGYGLSFLFLAMTVLLWLELISKFPPKGSGILGWFESILGIAVLGLIAYWFVDYGPVWNIIMPLFIQLLLLGIISFLIKKFNVFNRLFQAEPGFKIMQVFFCKSSLVIL